MAQRISDRVAECRGDAHLGRGGVGVVERHRAAAACVIDVDRVGRDEHTLSGEGPCGAERDEQRNQRRSGHQKNTTVSVMVPV